MSPTMRSRLSLAIALKKARRVSVSGVIAAIP
jgi:hypothetical protein